MQPTLLGAVTAVPIRGKQGEGEEERGCFGGVIRACMESKCRHGNANPSMICIGSVVTTATTTSNE